MSTQPTRSTEAEKNELPSEVIELVNAINKLPANVREGIDKHLERVVSNTKRRRKILSLVQDALNQLRLDMKYLLFDLEATRRERDDFRRQLEEKG